MALPEIGLKAVLQNKDFNRAITQYIRDVDRMVSHTNLASGGMGSQFLALGATVTKFAAITGAAILGVTSAVGGMVYALSKDSIKTAISFESAFAGVAKTVGGLTSDFGVLNEAGLALKQEFINLAEEVPFTVEELMRIGQIGGQLGIAKEDLIDFTRVIAGVAVSTDLTADQAARDFARFMNILGTPQSDIDKVASSVVDLGNKYATTEPEITRFALRIAGIGKVAGMTAPELLGIGNAMASVGVQSEAGGTAVQKILIAMMAAAQGSGDSFVDNTKAIADNAAKLEVLQERLAVAQQQQAEFTDRTKESTRMAKEIQIGNLIAEIEALTGATAVLNETHGMLVTEDTLGIFAETAGVSVAEFRRLWEEDATTAFVLFVEGLGKQGQAAIGTLDAIGLADQRLMRSVLSLAGGGELLNQSVTDSTTAWEENIAAAYEAAQRFATTESQIQLLKNTWRNLKNEIGYEFLPFFNTMLDTFRDLIKTHGPQLVELFEKHIVPAFNALVGAFGLLINGKVTDALTDIRGALTSLVGPETATQIWDTATAIYEFGKTAATFISEHAEELKAAFIAIGAILATAAIASSIAAIVAAISAIATPVGLIVVAIGALAAAWTGNWGGMRDYALAAWADLVVVWENIVNFFTVTIPVALVAVRDWFVQAWADIRAYVTATWEDLVTIWNGIVVFFTETIPAAATTLWKSIVAAFNNIWRSVVDTWNAAGKYILDVQDAIQKKIQKVWDGIVQFLKDAWDVIRITVLAGIILVLRLLGTNLDEIKAFWEKSWKEVGNALKTAWEGISRTVSSVFSAVKEFVATTLEGLRDGWEVAWNAIKTTAITTWEAISSAVSTAFNAVKGFIENTLEAIKTQWDYWWTLISSVATAVWDAIYLAVSTAVNEVKDYVEEQLEALKLIWEGIWTGIKDAATAIWDALVLTIQGAASTLKDALVTPVVEAKDVIVGMIGEWIQVGSDLINGVITGIKNVISNLTSAVGDAIGGAVDEAKRRLGIQSPSKVFAEIGRNIVQGLINGILAGKGNLQSTIIGLVDIGQAFGSLGSSAAGLFKSRTMDPLQEALNAVDNSLDALAKRRETAIKEATTSAKARTDEEIDAIKAEVAASIAGVKEETALRKQAIKDETNAEKDVIKREFDDRELALTREFDDRETLIKDAYALQKKVLKDTIEDEAELATALSALAAQELADKRALEDEERAARRALADEEAARIKTLEDLELSRIDAIMTAEAKRIADLKTLEANRSAERLKALDEEIARIEKANGMLTSAETLEYQRQLNALLAERARLAEEYAEAEERVLLLEKQQQDLAFLREQMNLLEFIKDRGLNARELLQGVELGINANLKQLLDVMSAAMQQVIDTAEAQFEIASPSKVFGRIGKHLMEGLSNSIDKFSSLPATAISHMQERVVAPALNGERMFASARIPAPVVRVNGGTQITQQFDLTAQYRYQEERELMDDVRLMRLMAGA